MTQRTQNIGQQNFLTFNRWSTKIVHIIFSYNIQINMINFIKQTRLAIQEIPKQFRQSWMIGLFLTTIEIISIGLNLGIWKLSKLSIPVHFGLTDYYMHYQYSEVSPVQRNEHYRNIYHTKYHYLQPWFHDQPFLASTETRIPCSKISQILVFDWDYCTSF